MKKIALVFIALLLFACSKSDDSDDRFEGTMEFKINGELVVFDSAGGYGFYDLNLSCSAPFHEVNGRWNINPPDGHLIKLRFSPSKGIGTYHPEASYTKWNGPYNSGNRVTYYQNHYCGNNNMHYAEEGEVTITSTANDRYKGIFHFTASDACGTDVVVITSGKFEILQKNPLSCD